MNYSLAGEDAPSVIREAMAWVCRSFANTPEAQRDSERLQKILATDLKELCSQQPRLRPDTFAFQFDLHRQAMLEKDLQRAGISPFGW